MRLLSFTLCLVTGLAQAQWTYDNSPTRQFDMSRNIINRTTIEWRYVEHPGQVQAACEAESRRAGNGGFGYGVMACSFFYIDRCTIITARQVDMRTIGHEVMHCFQFNWHN
jgi:hypothetical protein